MDMKVVHITEDFSMANTGVTASLRELISHVSPLVRMEVIAVGDEVVGLTRPVPVRLCAGAPWGRPWRYSPEFKPALRESLKDGSLFHIHGVWMAPQMMAAKRCVELGKPVALSPHNMLGSWFWKGLFRRIKKTVYWNLLSGPVFKRISALHALTVLERDALRGFFPGKRIEVIPNGVDMREVDRLLELAGDNNTDERYMLFLGRLHPVKGLEALIEAYSKLPPASRMRLKVAGPGHSEGYGARLRRLAAASGLEKDIEFLGPVYGVDKWRLLKNAWALCAPSYSEGMSMAALESMAAGVPVLTTYSAGILNVPEGGGLLINPDAQEIAGALKKAHGWSDSERGARSKAARALVEKRYCWDAVVPLYTDFYRSLKA